MTQHFGFKLLDEYIFIQNQPPQHSAFNKRTNKKIKLFYQKSTNCLKNLDEYFYKVYGFDIANSSKSNIL